MLSDDLQVNCGDSGPAALKEESTDGNVIFLLSETLHVDVVDADADARPITRTHSKEFLKNFKQ